jgi:hypothetical protein
MSDGSERYDQLMAFLNSQLPKPVREQHTDEDRCIFTGGEPPEVIVHLTESTVLVAQFTGSWEGGDDLTLEANPFGELYWRALPETALMNALGALIKGARESRLASYRPCWSCGEATPPEWLDAEDICRKCGAQSSSAVH